MGQHWAKKKNLKGKLLKTKLHQLKEQARKAYGQKYKEVKVSWQQGRWNFYETLVEEAEAAAHSNDMRTLY